MDEAHIWEACFVPEPHSFGDNETETCESSRIVTLCLQPIFLDFPPPLFQLSWHAISSRQTISAEHALSNFCKRESIVDCPLTDIGLASNVAFLSGRPNFIRFRRDVAELFFH